jgi:cytochrome P450
VRETLRLFPPIMQMAREVKGDIAVDGTPLARGSTALLNLYVLQRSRLWWDEPDRFDPQRFIDHGDEIRQRGLWLPFGLGPHGCIGAAFAQLELTLALGRLLGRFEFVPNPERPLEARVDFSLRPHGEEVLYVRPLP